MPSKDIQGPRPGAPRDGMVGPGRHKKCCRSKPRCRSCPVTLAVEVREVRELARPRLDVPPHLAGVPECLHKYEPLLRRSWEERAAEQRAAKERAAREHAITEPMRVPGPADRSEIA